MLMRCNRCSHSSGGRKCRYSKKGRCNHFQEKNTSHKQEITFSSGYVGLKSGWIIKNDSTVFRPKENSKK